MILFIGKPFKGNMFYEWQVGALVFQFQHDFSIELAGGHTNEMFRVGRFAIWHDPFWRDHMLILPRFLFKSPVYNLVHDWRKRNRPKYS